MRPPPFQHAQSMSLNKLLIFERFFIHFDTFHVVSVTILYMMTHFSIKYIKINERKRAANMKKN